MIKRALSDFFVWFWNATQRTAWLLLLSPILFILFPLSLIYWLGLLFSRAWRKFGLQRYYSDVPLVGIGNISVGGTGKTPLAIALLESLPRGAIIAHGYHESWVATTKQSGLLVSDKGFNTIDIGHAGDEGWVLGSRLKVPVFASRDRVVGLKELFSWITFAKRRVDYVVIDDAYQNHRLAKRVNILILDARAPYGNGFLLPAGNLRERNIYRGNIVVFSHSEKMNVAACNRVKRKLARFHGPEFLETSVFEGEHVFSGLYRAGDDPYPIEAARHGRFFAMAGVGSFQGYLNSLKKIGITCVETKSFPDHYRYSYSDVSGVQKRAKALGLDGIIVTEKDWVKVQSKILCQSEEGKRFWFVARVSFEFPKEGEKKRFVNRVSQLLKGDQVVF